LSHEGIDKLRDVKYIICERTTENKERCLEDKEVRDE
jgi:hypothetical protein